jgi:peroxiredoxin
LGFPVIAISPDQPSKLESSLEVKDLGYALYSDSHLDAARAFGIAFQLDDKGYSHLKGYGIDLEESTGEKLHQLPVPSVFLIERGGTIRWVYSNPDYKVRPDNEKLMKAARSVAGNAAN